MIQKLKNEFSDNRKYFFMSILLSVLTVLPEFIFFISWNRIFFLIILISISKFSKIVFSLFIIYINLVNILIIHVSMNWGKINKFEPIIELAYSSPSYETLEYLSDNVGFIDMLFIMYIFFIFILLYKFMRKYNNSYYIFKSFIFYICCYCCIDF